MSTKCSDCGAIRKPDESCWCDNPKKAKDKRTRWDKKRPEVKPWFTKAGFEHCELRWPGCNEAVGTGFAHAKNQRHLSERELYIVAYLCTNCHNKIEGKPFMEQIILDIRKRNSIPEIDKIINEYYGNNN